jgi:hypothetical protein
MFLIYLMPQVSVLEVHTIMSQPDADFVSIISRLIDEGRKPPSLAAALLVSAMKFLPPNQMY